MQYVHVASVVTHYQYLNPNFGYLMIFIYHYAKKKQCYFQLEHQHSWFYQLVKFVLDLLEE